MAMKLPTAEEMFEETVQKVSSSPEEWLEDARQQFAQAKEEVQKPFDKEDKLKYVQNRLTKINAELDMEPKTEPKLVKKEELKKCL